LICTCTALLILLSGFYTVGFEGDGLVLTQNALAAVVGDWGRTFISVALALFVFTSILYNYYLCENNLRFLLCDKRAAVIVYRGLVLLLILWGPCKIWALYSLLPISPLAFVNLIALALLFNVGMRLLRDYDQQRKAGIKTPVFDSSQFKDLDLDLQAWPNRKQASDAVPESTAQVASAPATP